MKLVELDSHPIIDKFRKEAGEFINDPEYIYHLLLPPEYNIDTEHKAVKYLFLQKATEPEIWIGYEEGQSKLFCRGNKLTPCSGFDQDFEIEILQTTPCTTTNGFSFDMNEIDSNPFMPSPTPPMCNDIQIAFENPNGSVAFLETETHSNEIKQILAALSKYSKKSINPDNKDEIVAYMHEKMDRISELIFEIKPFHFIPTIFKMRTNFIVFYAVTGFFHPKFLEVYHKGLEKQNSDAQKVISQEAPTVKNQAILKDAALHLKDLDTMPSVWEGIKMVTRFFNGVLSSLPDKNAAADDILPAVCNGIACMTGSISKRVVSTFQYLADIWSMEGLEERTTYILVTCSIASSHFASAEKKNLLNKLNLHHTIDVRKTQEPDTIQLIEDFLKELND